MNMRPVIVAPRHHREAVMVSEVDGVFVIEPMRFLYPMEAKAQAMRQARKAAA